MSQWYLIDGSMPADSPEEFPKVAIRSEAHLRDELGRLRERRPGIFALEGPDGLALQIGIGGPCAGIRVFNSGKAQHTVLTDCHHSEKRIDFAAEEDTLAFWPDELMPVERAIDIAAYLYAHRRLPDDVSWKEWNDGAKRWVVKAVE